MVPLGSDGHLVSGCQVVETVTRGWGRGTGAQALRSTVSGGHELVTVQAEQTVVGATAVVSAGLSAPGKVSRAVLDAGWQSQVLLISQTSFTARLAPAPGMVCLAPVSALVLLSAAIVTLGQHRQELSVKSHGRGGVSQLGRALWLGLKIRTLI